MRQLIVFTLAVCLVCSLMIGLSVTIGHLQPPSDAIRLFHMNDCETPCLMGVVVEKTSFAETRGYWQAFALPGYRADLAVNTREQIQLYLTSLAGKSDGLMWTYFDKGIATSTSLIVPQRYRNIITLADLVAFYGGPTCAYDAAGGRSGYRIVNIVDRAKSSIVQVFLDYPFVWTSPVHILSISKYNEDPCKWIRWRGIAATYPPN